MLSTTWHSQQVQCDVNSWMQASAHTHALTHTHTGDMSDRRQPVDGSGPCDCQTSKISICNLPKYTQGCSLDVSCMCTAADTKNNIDSNSWSCLKCLFNNNISATKTINDSYTTDRACPTMCTTHHLGRVAYSFMQKSSKCTFLKQASSVANSRCW